MSSLKTQIINGIPEIDVDEVFKNKDLINLIDVRRPDEFNNELGHVAHSKLITQGPDLDQYLQNVKDKDQLIVFICRSGNRSGIATLVARDLGLTQTFNMTGGMIRWNELQLPVERS